MHTLKKTFLILAVMFVGQFIRSNRSLTRLLQLLEMKLSLSQKLKHRRCNCVARDIIPHRM